MISAQKQQFLFKTKTLFERTLYCIDFQVTPILLMISRTDVELMTGGHLIEFHLTESVDRKFLII